MPQFRLNDPPSCYQKLDFFDKTAKAVDIRFPTQYYRDESQTSTAISSMEGELSACLDTEIGDEQGEHFAETESACEGSFDTGLEERLNISPHAQTRMSTDHTLFNRSCR
jgi:hypothetical protein